MKPQITTACLGLLAAAALAGCAGASRTAGLPSPAELDALTQKAVQESFKDHGIVKVKNVFADDETISACNAADAAGKPFLGSWKEGEKLAQSGRGLTFTDTAKTPNGGNCYNCHQIDKKEISFGTIGPSLYHYGKLRGVKDPNAPEARAMVEYTWGKIWNSKAYSACSNMPRAGHMGIMTKSQVADLVALLLDPQSPVNQ